jgi:hypothetical protein
METPKTINLRGHHLWNLQVNLSNIFDDFDYHNENKNKSEHKQLDYILYTIANNLEMKVRIINSEDDACDVCRNKPDGKCNVASQAGKDYLPKLDRDTARYYGLECGEVYTAKEIFEALRSAKSIDSEKELYEALAEDQAA